MKTSADKKPRSGCLRLLVNSVIAALVIVLIVAGWVKYNVYASLFTPTELSVKEQEVLDSKLARMTESAQKERSMTTSRLRDPETNLKPEKYTEEGARREISLTEKEMNALIANDPEIAKRVAIDLSDNLISVKLVVPIDKEVIIFGGKTLRLNLGLIMSYENNRPIIAIKGISLGGIPLPNAWLGYIKEKNLIEEFGSETGFWKLFAEGIRDIKVKEGHILVRLNE